MAEIATQDQFVEDVHGIRRRVVGGQPVPNGLFPPGSVEATTVPTSTLGQPVIDEAASQPSGTAADPQGGISHDHTAAIQADAREQGEAGSGSKRQRAKAQD